MYNSPRGDFMDFAYKLRESVFNEWLEGRLCVKALCKKYGFSRKWFYKYKKRFLDCGFNGLKDKVRSAPCMPHALGIDKKIIVLDYVYWNPTHGAGRISMNLEVKGTKISEGGVYNFLSSEGLNRKKKRILWAESQGRRLLTQKQKAYLQAQHRHVESHEPGSLISVDTFWLNIKNMGRIYQYTACDTYSSYGWAKVYKDRTSDNTVDFLENHILKSVPAGKIKRMLTDQGIEFYSARHNTRLHCINMFCKQYNIAHTLTKRAHPWTNGYAERLNRTTWDEFYLCRLTKEFNDISELQKELDSFMMEYNFNRIHTGYKLKENGYKYPYEAFIKNDKEKNLAMECYHLT